MTRRSGTALAVLLLLLAGPLGLLELDHDALHAHAGEESDHPECPVCFASKEPVSLHLPPAPLLLVEEGLAACRPLADRLESAERVRSTPTRGPPSLS